MGQQGISLSMAMVVAWLVPFVVVGCSVSERVILRCDYGNTLQDVYSLDEKAGSVRLMAVEPPRPGLLSVTDSAYRLEFPENNPADGYQLLKVEINRFTSQAHREIGREQTVTYQGQVMDLHVVRDAGNCVRIKEGDTL